MRKVGVHGFLIQNFGAHIFTQISKLLEPSTALIESSRGSLFSDLGADGFTARVKMIDKRSGYVEYTNLVYLLAENIQTFDAFVKARPKSVRHLVATCEGLAFGGCRKSIMQHLFTDGAYTRLQKFGFGLETMVVPARGQAHRHFQYGIKTGMIKADKIGGYLGGVDQVYKISRCSDE